MDEFGEKPSRGERLRAVIVGGARSPRDGHIFRNLSLIAVFAWVGLGADGLSSSCYGPWASFLALGGHTHLGLLVALATALTIFVISTSYSQIVEVFPNCFRHAAAVLPPGSAVCYPAFPCSAGRSGRDPAAVGVRSVGPRKRLSDRE